MTDSERDQIDQDAQIFMRTCSEAIRQLRSEGGPAVFPPWAGARGDRRGVLRINVSERHI